MCASMHACMWEEDVLVCACMLMHVFKCFEAKVKRLAGSPGLCVMSVAMTTRHHSSQFSIYRVMSYQ